MSLATKKYGKAEAGSVSKIPAGEIEKFVVENVKEVLLDKERIQKLVADLDVSRQKELIKTSQSIEDFSNPRLVRSMLHKVVISKNSVEIILCEKAIPKTLKGLSNGKKVSDQQNEKEIAPLIIRKKIKLSQSSQSGNILILNAGNDDKPEPNPYLVSAIVKSHHYHNLLLEGKIKDICGLQQMEGLKDTKYIRNILGLKFLPPQLTEQILNGTQSADLSLQKLIS